MSYYCINQSKQQDHAICEKCNDRYVIHGGRFSQRTSCRHHWWIDGFCRDCHIEHNAFNSSKGCYHTSMPLCCQCYCTIS